jgi:signal transduction histidine kinase
MAQPERLEEQRTSSVEPITADPVSAYARTRFLERIAHDLRGPSGVALGALDEITAAIASGDNDRIAPLLRIARRAQAKVLRVAEKLSRTAMMVQGTPIEDVLVELGPIVERSAQAAESVEGRRNVRCVTEGVHGAGAIRGDAGWLEVILTELVADAISHARSAVRVAVKRSEGSAAIEITSDGRSTPPNPRPLLAPSDDKRGLGVSMSLAALFMDAIGGTFEAGEFSGSPGVRLRFVDRPRKS